MKILILLIVLAGAGIFFYPRVAEHTDNACTALELRIAAVVQDQLKTLPAGADPRLAAALNAVRTAAPIGGLADAYVHDRFPALPPEIGCVGAYWKLMLDSNVTKFTAGALPLIQKRG
jgi:hypothetical protein